VRVFAGRLGPARRRYRLTDDTAELPITWMGIAREDLGGPAQRLVNGDVERCLERVLDDFRPDVVHFHNITALSIAVIAACRRRRIPTVMTLHDYWGICFKHLMIKNDGRLCTTGGFACLGCSEVLAGVPALPSPVRNAHILLALRDVDRFISPSRYLAERFVANGLPADRMRVVPNGVDLRRYRGRARGDGARGLTVGYIGQLIEHKGIEVLLRALRLLGDDTRLVVVGDGVQAGELERRSRELGIAGRVTFAGLVDNRDIAKIHAEVDVVAVPSVWPENSPVVIAEAMASAIPVVASDIGGIPELVEDGVTGFLVPPRDADALADRLAYLRRHPDERRRMGARAAERIQRHELRQQVASIVEILESVVEGRGAGDDRTTGATDIVLYHGAHEWDVAVRGAMYQIASLDGARSERALVCRIDLVAPETIDRATMLVIPSANEDSFRYACAALGRGVPIVVHEAARELKALCLASNAGLFYAGAELRACIELLLSDRALRAALGANGRTFYAASAS
jgi:glycosyltransferase involved in cell wall biosynthesis